MTGVAKWLKNKLGTIIVPKTMTSCVFDENGVSLDELLEGKQEGLTIEDIELTSDNMSMITTCCKRYGNIVILKIRDQTNKFINAGDTIYEFSKTDIEPGYGEAIGFITIEGSGSKTEIGAVYVSGNRIRLRAPDTGIAYTKWIYGTIIWYIGL